MFKVTAHVFRERNDNDKRSYRGMAGRMTFVTHEYDLAARVAMDGIDLPADCHANVDFNMLLPLAGKGTWVPARIDELESAAEVLMRAAQDIRNHKPKLNGASHHDELEA